MNISRPFIRRPVMTVLVMVTLAFFGILSYRSLPVSDLPDVEYPTIQVSVNYPGANPETIASNVVVPLEQQFASLTGIDVISSTSYTGSATIVLQFHLDRDIDKAATDVQAALNAAQAQLPQNLPYMPTYTKVNPTASPILFLDVTSEAMSPGELYDYAYTIISQRLSIVEGVSSVQIYGSPFAVRMRVDPQKLAARGIGLDDVATALQQANVNQPLGTLFGQKREYTINATGQLFKAEDYNPIIIKNQDGSIVRFRDIGHAIDSVQDDKVFVEYFDKTTKMPMVAMGVLKQAGANALTVIADIDTVLENLKSEIPAAIEIRPIFDESEFIWESVHDVELTLSIALLLVVLVVFFYLGKVRDTLIPVIAIPISVLGTFIVMKQLGFTIDILSLLAITLAIGYLVDDAIVVLENIVRHIENGEKPLEAALRGSREIGLTILSMTICLCTIFIPLLAMPGLIGRIFHEFAVTIISTVLISGFVSLTLTPLMASRFIPEKDEKKQKTRIERFSEALNNKILSIYNPSLEWALHHKKYVLLGGLLSLVLSVFLLVKLPKDFLPPDDLGLIEAYVQTVDGTSPFLIADYMDQLSKAFVNTPYVASITSVGSYPQDNEGIMYVKLVPFSQRPNLIDVMHELDHLTHMIPGVDVFLKPLPLINLQVGAVASKGDYQYTLQSLNDQDVYKFGPIMTKKMKSLKSVHSVVSDLDITQPQLNVEILRDRASVYNITAAQIENVLGYAFATTNLTPINTASYQYYGIMEVFPRFYRDPAKLSQIWLRSPNNEMVPLSAVARMTESIGPLTVNHIDGLPSATISFDLAPNVPLQTAIKDIKTIAKQTLPSNVLGSVQGAADVFEQSFSNMPFLLLITIFIVYVILGILYENFFPPITVLSTLPPAALGGFISLLIFGMSLSLYAFVGLIMLLGIVLKNGIIMIDFANESRLHEGKSIHDAIHHACMVRCRPILMTTFAALMGAVPIALGIGGMTAQSRRPLGVVIVGGLIISQVLTLYLTPIIYVYVETLHEKLKHKRQLQNSTTVEN